MWERLRQWVLKKLGLCTDPLSYVDAQTEESDMEAMYLLEKFIGRNTKTYVHIKSKSNGNILFSSQGYKSDPEQMINKFLGAFKKGTIEFVDKTVQ